MKILVTGCMGFIGSNLVSHLLRQGHKIIGIDNLVNPSIMPTDRIKTEAGDKWANFSFWNLDITEEKSINALFYNESPEYVVHLAALGSVPRSFANPTRVIQTNEAGFSNVLLACASHKVKRLIYASSSSVYGASPLQVRSEGDPPMPRSPYALSKLNNEVLASLMYEYCGIESLGMRFFNVYGPGQNSLSPYAAVIPKFFNNDVIIINGDGSQVRDFTYVGDVCEAIAMSLKGPAKNTILNIGTGHGTSINRLAELIGEGKKQIEYREARHGDVKTSVANTFKTEKLLGFKAHVPIEQGIDIVRDFYKKYGLHAEIT